MGRFSRFVDEKRCRGKTGARLGHDYMCDERVTAVVATENHRYRVCASHLEGWVGYLTRTGTEVLGVEAVAA